MSLLVDRDQQFLEAVRLIADEVAGRHAGEVDRDARFPSEAIDALRECHALSALVPEGLGGGGVSLPAVARGCFELGRRCAASAMVFAMHQIQVGTIARHLDGAAWFEAYLGELVREQRLIASVTSEIGTGGDMGRSIAAVVPGKDGLMRLEKQAPTVSYGAHCDDLFTTVRRSEQAEPGDQVLVLSRATETELEPVGTWDTIGMRGTCSPGFVVRARFGPEQVVTAPFSTVMNESLVPLSHILDVVGILPHARYVVYFSIEPDWWDSVDMADALHPQTLVTYGMNGSDLPVGHGGPLRLRVPRQLGYKNVKYITRLTVTDDLKQFGAGLGSASPEGGYAWYAGI